jgi:hypothetical protein
MRASITRSSPRLRSMADVTDTPPDLSVLFLVSEHPEPLAELYREYVLPLKAPGRSVECVFAVEPGHRHRTDELQQAEDREAPIRILHAAHSMGETGLVRMALPHCRAPALLILVAYRRVESGALPALARMLDDADLIVARRWPRKDSWVNRLQSRLFHGLVGRFTNSEFQDMASGVRAVRRELLEELPLYGDLYRFLPVLAVRDGFRVREVDCAQHPNDARTRVYGPTVYLRRALDILGLYFLVRFTEKPLRFFGLVGGILSLLGTVLLIILFVQRLSGQGIADRPVLLLGVLLFVLGVQAIALGLVGEIVVHVHATRQRRYRLARPVRSE